MLKKNRKLIYILLLLFGLYILAGMILAKRQDDIIFNPDKLDSSYQFDISRKHKEFNLQFSQDSRLNILYIYADSANGQILYFHDFSGNMKTHLSEIEPFLENNKNVFIIDYPGYGKSTGTPTEKSLNRSAKILYKLAINYLPPDSTIIYGKGAGSAVAAYLASKKKNKKLVLVNPFYDLYDVVGHYFPIYPTKKYLHYNFPTYHYVKRVLSPVILIYNKKGQGFFYDQAIKLSKVLFEKDTFIDRD